LLAAQETTPAEPATAKDDVATAAKKAKAKPAAKKGGGKPKPGKAKLRNSNTKPTETGGDDKPVSPPGAAAAGYVSAAPSFTVVPMTRFDGQSELPAYVAGSGPVYSDGVGLGDGSVLRTVAGDLHEHDFVVDFAFKFRKDEQSIFSVGIGHKPEAIVSRVHGPGHGGYATFGLPGKGENQLGKWPAAGLAIFRLEKQGDDFTMALGAFEKGEFAVVAAETIAKFSESTPFLRRPVASVFVEATGGAILGMRMIVDGKPAAPLPTRNTTAAPSYSRSPMVPLVGKSGLPGFLQALEPVTPSAAGVQRGTMRTHATRLHERDFVADMQFRFASGEQSILLFGLGGAKPGGLGWNDAVYSRIHGPGYGGYATFSIAGQDEKQVGKFATAGPHVMRMEKRGGVLTLSVGDVADGELRPYFSKSLLNLKDVTAFLQRDNSFLSLQTGSAVIEAIRVLVDGKPAETRAVPAENMVAGPRTPAAMVPRTSDGPPVNPPAPPPIRRLVTPPLPRAPVPPSAPESPASPASTASLLEPVPNARGVEHLLPLVAGGWPTFLASDRDTAFVVPRGVNLEKRLHRTIRTDFIDRDFTFDAVIRFRDGESVIAVIGIGPGHLDHNGAVLRDCVCSRVHGPGHGGYGTFTIWGQPEKELGRFVSGGPHLFRLQKKGQRLTMAISPSFKDRVSPTIEQTVLDLKSAAPYLNSTNSYLFFGAAGVVEAVRLIVDKEPIESRDVPINLPRFAIAGKPVTAKLPAAGNPRFALDSPPTGAKLSAIGDFAWTPVADQLGQFPLRVMVARQAGGIDERLVVPHVLNVVSAADAQRAGGDPAKVDKLYSLPFASEKLHVANGADGQSLLLLDGRKVSRLVGDGIAVSETWDLPVACERIAERPNYFVALSDEKKALLFIDKKTKQIDRVVQMDYFRRHDIALHPTKPWVYVSASVSRGGDLMDSFMIVDETTGDVQEPEGLAGTWLAASRDGKSLYVGEKQYRFNSSFDSLASYDLREIKRPYTRNIKYEPGANGRGLVLSADGKRVSYLTFTGYPMYSKNIAAWDTSDLEKRPVIYPCKERGASCFWIAYHPRLPLVAAPIETGGAACFHRETGEPIPDAANVTYPPLVNVTVDRLYFSPDGANLLLECQSAGQRFLRRVPLQLTSEWRQRLEK
jgi:hypothetical protein